MSKKETDVANNEHATPKHATFKDDVIEHSITTPDANSYPETTNHSKPPTGRSESPNKKNSASSRNSTQPKNASASKTSSNAGHSANKSRRSSITSIKTGSPPKTSSQHGTPDPTREFHVTHTSDNWKLRKAMRQASLEKKAEEISKTSSNDKSKSSVAAEDKPDNTNVSKEIPETVSTEDHPQVSKNENDRPNSKTVKRQVSDIGDVLLRIREREKTILPQLITLDSKKSETTEVPSKTFGKAFYLDTSASAKQANYVSSASAEKQVSAEPYDEGFAEGEAERVDNDEDGVFNDDDDSSGFSDSASREKPLISEDFDTDLSDDSDAEGSPRLQGKNRTLQTYLTACTKCRLPKNPTFVRQCGRGSIDIRNRMLTFRDAKPIAIAMVADKRASSLDISDNPLGPLGTAYIAEMMFANRNIIELNLSNTQPDTDGIGALAQTLRYNTSIRRLHLDNNGLQQRDGEHLAEIMATTPDLRELYLNNNTLGFSGSQRIARALASNQGRLSVLNLQYNNIRTDSAVQLALALAKNTTLRSLNVAWNGFGSEGCRALAASLGVNKTLKELDLRCNRLGLSSLRFLIKGLISNTGLSCVKVGTNPMTTEGAKALISAIATAEDSGLNEIDIQDVPIDDEFLALVAKLQEKKVVRVIHDTTVHMATTDQTREFDGTNLDRFDPVMVLFEYMKKDNLRVIDLFQFFDTKKRDKLSRNDLRDGLNILMIPFTEHAIDQIMKTLDSDKDGYLTLEEMTKGYRENDRAVKLRRIKANQKNKKDKGLEDLWQILKELIEKRKAQNEKRSTDKGD